MKGRTIYAYTAGMIDGDGCISLRKKTSPGRRGYIFGISVSVGSTDEWLCQWLKMQFGSAIHAPRMKKSTWKQYYLWAIADKKAYELLKLVKPYLQIKRQQAEVCMLYQERRRNTGAGGKTNAEWALDEADKVLMTKLNKKGSDQYTPDYSYLSKS